MIPIELLISLLEQVRHRPANGVGVTAAFQGQIIVEKTDEVVTPSITDSDAIVRTGRLTQMTHDDTIRVGSPFEDFIEHIFQMGFVLPEFIGSRLCVDRKQQPQPTDDLTAVIIEFGGYEAAWQQIVVGQPVGPFQILCIAGYAVQARQHLQQFAVDFDVLRRDLAMRRVVVSVLEDVVGNPPHPREPRRLGTGDFDDWCQPVLGVLARAEDHGIVRAGHLLHRFHVVGHR